MGCRRAPAHGASRLRTPAVRPVSALTPQDPTTARQRHVACARFDETAQVHWQTSARDDPAVRIWRRDQQVRETSTTGRSGRGGGVGDAAGADCPGARLGKLALTLFWPLSRGGLAARRGATQRVLSVACGTMYAWLT